MRTTLTELGGHVKSLSRCVWPVLAVFVFFLSRELIERMCERETGNSLYNSINLIMGFLVSPFFYSGFAACIRRCLTTEQEKIGLGYFFQKAPQYYFPCLFIRLVTYLAVVAAQVMLASVDLSGLAVEPSVLLELIIGLVSTLQFCWICVLIVDGGRFWTSLGRCVKLVSSQAIATAIALLWLALTFVPDWISSQIALRLGQELPGVSSLMWAVQYALGYIWLQAIYIRYKSECLGEEVSALDDLPAQQELSVADALAVRAYRLGWLAIVPPLCVAALFWGIRALRKGTQQQMSAYWGCVSGGLFTFFYVLLLLGTLLPKPQQRGRVAYQFLVDHEPGLQSTVDLLDSHAYVDAEAELEALIEGADTPDWPYLCAHALIKWYNADYEAAKRLLQGAEQQAPQVSEFYSLYGTFLQADDSSQATDMFRQAIALDQNNKVASTELALASSVYEPNQTLSYITYGIILLLLITFHEYGHAYTAWKLGDDTAMQQGRVSFNPLQHIDLFGSIILPGILIYSGSEFLFGWAKPVPVDVHKLRNQERDYTKVSLAGPGMNMVIAVLAFIAMTLLLLVVRIMWPDAVSQGLTIPFSSSMSLIGTPMNRSLLIIIGILQKVLFTSVLLGVFNLIPIPPLDGSWLLSALLKGKAKAAYEKLRPYSMLLFLGLVFTSALDYILVVPAFAIWGFVSLACGAMGFQ